MRGEKSVMHMRDNASAAVLSTSEIYKTKPKRTDSGVGRASVGPWLSVWIESTPLPYCPNGSRHVDPPMPCLRAAATTTGTISFVAMLLSVHSPRH